MFALGLPCMRMIFASICMRMCSVPRSVVRHSFERLIVTWKALACISKPSWQYLLLACERQHSVMRRVERASNQQGRAVRRLRIPRGKSSKPTAQYSHGTLVAGVNPLQLVYECLSASRTTDLAQHAVKDNVLFLLGQLGCEVGHTRFEIARGHMSRAHNVSNSEVVLRIVCSLNNG